MIAYYFESAVLAKTSGSATAHWLGLLNRKWWEIETRHKRFTSFTKHGWVLRSGVFSITHNKVFGFKMAADLGNTRLETEFVYEPYAVRGRLEYGGGYRVIQKLYDLMEQLLKERSVSFADQITSVELSEPSSVVAESRIGSHDDSWIQR